MKFLLRNNNPTERRSVTLGRAHGSVAALHADDCSVVLPAELRAYVPESQSDGAIRLGAIRLQWATRGRRLRIDPVCGSVQKRSSRFGSFGPLFDMVHSCSFIQRIFVSSAIDDLSRWKPRILLVYTVGVTRNPAGATDVTSLP
ncbi:hypothetical protein J6590_001329 [Homalodisca vitripennis]|nr:hypothetical protein J6590_001329 [Homalodisca vitripennis]